MPLTDSSAWELRAVWWNPTWRYRLPLDITAAVAATDGTLTIPVNWAAVLAQVQNGQTVDPNSLRLVEYSAGGHVIVAYLSTLAHISTGYNRFDRCPVEPVGGNVATLRAMIPGDTAAAQTRRFMLYFDTLDNPKASYDYSYLSATAGGSGVTVQRSGPETENLGRTISSLFQNAGGFSTLFNNTTTRTFGFPTLDGAALINAASYSIGDHVATANLTAALTGAGMSGTLAAEVVSQYVGGTLGSQTILGQVIRGTLTLTPTSPLAITAGQVLRLLQETTVSAASSAWIDTPAQGTALAVAVRTALPLGTLVGIAGTSGTAVLRIDSLSGPAVFGGSGNLTAYRPSSTVTGFDLVATGSGTWDSSSPLTFGFTLYAFAQVGASYGAAFMAAQLAGAAAGNFTATLDPTKAVAYSLDLLHDQFRYYEDKLWGWIQNTVLPHGWGVSWNIVYGYDTATGLYQQGHDNDSTMGAGFLLYAASLKAVMTGEQRFYDIANAYANYMIQLEAEDVAEHGAAASGRISYGYNGGPGSISFNNSFPQGTTAAGTVCNMTSWDQVATATLGLWLYTYLDPLRATHTADAQALLGRAALFLRTGDVNVTPQNSLMNIRTMLGLDTAWYDGTTAPGGQNYSQSNLNANGSVYSLWLAGQSGYLSPGNSANSYFISSVQDKLFAGKDATKLHNKQRFIDSDAPTAARGVYPVIPGTSYTLSWGQDTWEWPVIGALSAVVNGLTYTGGSPESYQQMIGGSRDGISARHAEACAAELLGYGEYPGEYLPARGNANYLLREDFARHVIHTMLGTMMDDNGAITELAVGTLGRASAVTHTREFTDLTAYSLLALALYRAFILKEVSYPFPVNGHNYLQGIGEAGGTVTLSYLGNLTYQQQLRVPVTNRPLLCGGLLTSPVLTIRPDGTAAELTGNAITLPVTMALNTPATATIRQLPVEVSPALGSTVTVQPSTWSGSGGILVITPSASGPVRVRVYGLTAGALVTFSVNSVTAAQAIADATGRAEAVWTVGSGAQTLTIAIGGPMAGGKSNYLANKVLDLLFGGTALVQPGTWYMALFTVAPTAAGGGTEVSGNGYARVAVTNNGANWPAASGQQKSNANVISWPQATADWGTVVAWAAFDAPTGGNMWYFGPLTQSQYVYAAGLMSIHAGALVLTEA